MITSTKLRICALLLLIVIVLIQMASVDAKGGAGRASGRSSPRSSWSSGSRWSTGNRHRSWGRGGSSFFGRSSGSVGTWPSLLLIAAGLLAVVFLDSGSTSSYNPSDDIRRPNALKNRGENEHGYASQ